MAKTPLDNTTGNSFVIANDQVVNYQSNETDSDTTQSNDIHEHGNSKPSIRVVAQLQNKVTALDDSFEFHNSYVIVSKDGYEISSWATVGSDDSGHFNIMTHYSYNPQGINTIIHSNVDGINTTTHTNVHYDFII